MSCRAILFWPPDLRKAIRRAGKKKEERGFVHEAQLFLHEVTITETKSTLLSNKI